jgi:hypothetical protein
VIDLFGGLKIDKQERRVAQRTDLLTGKAVGGRKGSARVVFEFSAPDLVWNADEKLIAAEVATAIGETIRDNMLAGNQGDGSPLPAASSKTLERRQYRLEQAARGGAPSMRYANRQALKKRQAAHRNWDRRFKAARLGAFTPMPGETRFGLESGMLARSIVAAPTAGGAWQVYFAQARAKLDRTGSSAALRVFKRMRPWSEAMFRQPRLQEALRRCQANLLGSRARLLFQQLQRTAQLVQQAAQAEAA